MRSPLNHSLGRNFCSPSRRRISRSTIIAPTAVNLIVMPTGRYLISALLGLIILWPTVVLAIDGDCNDDARIRVVKGDNKRGQKLYTPIMGKFPSWDKNFHEEQFTYVGLLKNGIEVG